jgi:hypothetical protein
MRLPRQTTSELQHAGVWIQRGRPQIRSECLAAPVAAEKSRFDARDRIGPEGPTHAWQQPGLNKPRSSGFKLGGHGETAGPAVA